MTNLSDVQVYDYMDDEGQKVQITLAVHGDPNKYRTVDFTLYVDEKKRVWATDHAGLPPGVPLGEHVIFGALSCLRKHVDTWCVWAIAESSFASDDNSPSVGEPGYEPMPVDMRHWKELDDEATWWWVEHPSLFLYLVDRVKPAALEAIEKYKEELSSGPTEEWF